MYILHFKGRGTIRILLYDNREIKKWHEQFKKKKHHPHWLLFQLPTHKIIYCI